MKKLICLLSLFLLTDCSSNKCSGMWLGGRSNSTACNIELVSALVVVTPIFAVTQPIRVASEHHQKNAAQKERYQQYLTYKKGVENNDYNVIKKCIENCSSRIIGESYFDPNIHHVAAGKLIAYYKQGLAKNDYDVIIQCMLDCSNGLTKHPDYDPTMQEDAAKKLIMHKPICIKNNEYPIYFSAYIYLIKQQRQANKAPNKTLLKDAWQWYQNANEMESYTQKTESLCVQPTKDKKGYSMQHQLKNGHYLKAELFVNTIKPFNIKLQKDYIKHCPKWIPEYKTEQAHKIKAICTSAYRLHYGLKDKNDTHKEAIKTLSKQWDDQLKNSQPQR